jgi:hypothetical protein
MEGLASLLWDKENAQRSTSNIQRRISSQGDDREDEKGIKISRTLQEPTMVGQSHAPQQRA